MQLKKLVREMSFYSTCFDDPKNEAVKQSDRIKVNFSSYPSGLQIADYKTFSYNGDQTKINYDFASIMLNHVDSIENLKIGDDKINTAVLLCDYKDARLYKLLVEIKGKLLEAVEVVTEKEK